MGRLSRTTRIVLASAVGLLLVAVVAVVVVATSQTERTFTYDGRGSAEVAQLGVCAGAQLTGDAAAQVAAIPGSAVWSDVTVTRPTLRVDLTDCATGAPVQVDRVRLWQTWSDPGCRLRPTSGEPLDGTEEGWSDGWWVAQSLEPCTDGVLVGVSSTTHSDGAGVYDEQVLTYRGRVWGRQLCLAPTLTIDVTKGAISSSADIALPPSCTSA